MRKIPASTPARRAHAGNIRHGGRSLYEHLIGTHELLREWGASEQVRLAGLFHSIYGTRHFRKSAWPLVDRMTIRNLIGDEAEFLAYLFCVTDRPKALLVAANSLRDHHAGNMHMLDAKTMRSLREIEAANLLDQGGRHWLEKLRDYDISKSAKQTIDKRLEGKRQWPLQLSP